MRYYSAKLACLMVSLVIICAWVLTAQPLRKSDLYISHVRTLQMREDYSVSNIAWGFLPLKDLENQLPFFIQNAEMIRDEGRTFHARIEFDAGWRLFGD